MEKFSSKAMVNQQKHERPRSAVGNAGWNAFSTIWGIAISFVIAPVLIHSIGTAQYGLFLLIGSFTGILGFVGFGFGDATLRFVAHYHANGDSVGVNRVFGSTLSFYTVVCAGILLILIPTAPWLVAYAKIPAEQYYLAGWLIRIAALVFSVGIITSAFAAIPMALHRYDISSKVSIGQNVVRSIGYICIAVSGLGLFYLLLWDLVVQMVVFCVQVTVARRLLPEINWIPRFSFAGLREIVGYSTFSFLTNIFHSMYRESGKLAVGAAIGPSAVAYLGTADNVAYRIYMVIISGVETLVPKFSATSDTRVARALVLNATWASLAASITFLVPLAALMPDFLRLWISPEFARESARVGQMVALSFLAPAAFAPMATLFRGAGKPWFVTIVMALAGVCLLIGTLMLIPSLGIIGVGYGYLLSCTSWIAGLVIGWFYIFGSTSFLALLRVVALPALVGALAYALQTVIRQWSLEMGWMALFAYGVSFAGSTALLLIVIDWISAETSCSKQLFDRLSKSRKVASFLRWVPASKVL